MHVDENRERELTKLAKYLILLTARTLTKDRPLTTTKHVMKDKATVTDNIVIAIDFCTNKS
jgi:hypothetical protein